jgi:hypothetical protein
MKSCENDPKSIKTMLFGQKWAKMHVFSAQAKLI